MKTLILIVALLLAGCQHPVIKEVPVEVRIPVVAPCMGEKPQEPQALKEKIAPPEWSALATDQRQARLSSAALERKIYGDRLTVASAGCP